MCKQLTGTCTYTVFGIQFFPPLPVATCADISLILVLTQYFTWVNAKPLLILLFPGLLIFKIHMPLRGSPTNPPTNANRSYW